MSTFAKHPKRMPVRMPADPIQMNVMTETTFEHRSDAMYLLHEALARARCAEPPRRSRPAREVAMEAARRRRRSQ